MKTDFIFETQLAWKIRWTVRKSCMESRDLTRLDGARGKKQVWRPNVRK